MRLNELLDQNHRGQKLAVLFPGQGSQSLGMGRDFYSDLESARLTFEEACDVLHVNIKKLCFEGPLTDLTLTENLQPSLLTVEIAQWRCIEKEFGPQVSFFAGHSLGEYSAVVAAKSITFAQALNLTKLRGKAMQEAVPAGEGGMVALLGLNDSQEALVKSICSKLSQTAQLHASIANYNAPGQIVVAGTILGLDALTNALKDSPETQKIKVLKLPVSAPFHCALMQPAKQTLAQPLKASRFLAPATAVVQNLTAKAASSAADLCQGLLDQITAPVLWRQSLEFLKDQKIESALEVGPGQVLAGLLKRTTPDIACISVNSMKVFLKDE